MATILITGAGSGFGRAAAIALAGRGHDVIATTERSDQADALRAEAPELRVEQLDITTADVEKVDAWDVDVLIDNAGAGQFGPLAEVPLDIVRHLFEVNVFGTLAVTQRVLAGMIPRGSGRVIIVSSIAGLITAPATGPYAMTKHALEAMGKTMRAELAPLGIDVCLLNPGPYDTGFNDRMAASMWTWFGTRQPAGADHRDLRAGPGVRHHRSARPCRGRRQAGRAGRGRDHRGEQPGAARRPRLRPRPDRRLSAVGCRRTAVGAAPTTPETSCQTHRRWPPPAQHPRSSWTPTR